MKRFFKSAAVAAALITGASTGYSTLVINISSGEFLNSGGSPVVAGTLFQLVNLGANNVFDQISVGDGSTTGLAQWVSGDDSVLNISVIGGDSATFPTTAAFDLSVGVETPGVLERVFEFASAAFPQNTNVGIRWFPGLSATAFNGITLQAGQSYGQFTRSVSKYGDSIWRVSLPDGNITFDPLATAALGGTDPTGPTDDARAHFVVVPEPAAIGLSLLGAAGLSMLRRRRA